MKELSIIVPAYNEGKIIFNTIKEIEKIFDNPGSDYEVVVVDNGSTDNTYSEAIKASNSRVKVVKCEEKGKGLALKHGFKNASGKFITFIDADLDLHPNQISLFIEYMEKFDADVVVGSKRHPLSKVNYPWHRKFLSNGYYILIRTLFGLPVKDTQVGLKLFKHEVLKEILHRVLVKKYAFDLELLVNAHHRNFKIVEVPIELNSQRKFSRIRFKDIWDIFVDTAAIFYRLYIMRYYDQER